MQSPVQLARYDNRWYKPGGTFLRRTLWFFLGQPVLGSPLIPSSALRVSLLRLFGARIGAGVTIKPSVQVTYPWHLVVGDHTWIGEHAWIDNLTTVRIGANVCISQGAYLCTGNHDWSDPAFGLMIAPVQMGDGSWAGAKSILTPGTTLGTGAIAAAGAVVTGTIPDLAIFSGNPARLLRYRSVRPSPDTAIISPKAHGDAAHGVEVAR